MATNRRTDTILELLMRNDAMSVRRLAEALSVSEMTVRRDLAKMQREMKIRLVNGVAFCPRDGETVPYDLEQQLGVHCREKDAIGRAAAAMLVPGDSVFIDCGSTASAMLRYIPHGMDITVICSTLNVLTEARRKDIQRLVFTGGYYHPGTETFESPEAVRMLGGIRSSKAFITASGVSRELGLTCVEQYETAVKRVAMENGMKRILLVDSSKFSRVSPAFFGAWSSIDEVITDEGVTEEWKAFLREQHIVLTIAEQEHASI